MVLAIEEIPKLVSSCTLQYSHSMRDLNNSKSFMKFFECLAR